MNQSEEEIQEQMKPDRDQKRFGEKKKILVIAVLALIAIPVLAWLFFQRSLQTVTRINEPHALEIGAGDARNIEELELNNIDVSGEQKYKDVVFCVYSRYRPMSYNLQLAHTTNIGFQYAIYPATKAPSGGNVTYLGTDYNFDPGSPVQGGYLNQDENSQLAKAGGEYHNKTYAKSDRNSYGNVQKYAEPLYWKTNTELTLPETIDNEHYIDYYVLRISWDEGVQNNKETDMVYLMAEATGTAGTNP